MYSDWVSPHTHSPIMIPHKHGDFGIAVPQEKIMDSTEFLLYFSVFQTPYYNVDYIYHK